MYKKTINLILVLSIIFSIIPLESHAISKSDFDEWFNLYSQNESQMVASSLGVAPSVSGHYLNKYFLNLGNNSKLVYGTPFDWKAGHGYRYLGYNQKGDPFTNPDFIPDSLDGTFDPTTRNWVKKPWDSPHVTLISSQGLPKPKNPNLSYTPNWLKEAYTTTVGDFKLTEFGLPADDLHLYASVVQSPATYTEGEVILYHYRNGAYWYLTLTVPPEQAPQLDNPTIDIKAKSQDGIESSSIVVKEGEAYEIIDKSKSAYESFGSFIIRYEVKKENKINGNWQIVDSRTLKRNANGDDRASFFKAYTDTEGEYRYTITEIEDLLGPISKSARSVYVNVTNDEGTGPIEPDPDPDPEPVEPPPKPEVDKPDIDIWIVPRDEDPSTPYNEIYEGEHIRIQGTVKGGFDYRWRFYSKGSNQSDDGFINGLFLADEPDDEAEALQRADYMDYVWNPETSQYDMVAVKAEDDVGFTVKQIKPPVIEVSGGLTDSNLNIVHLREPIEIKTIVYDINEPSEQHPEGFDVVGESWRFIKKSTGEVVLSGTGVLNTNNFIFQKGVFETDEYYTLRTTAHNAFKPIRKTEHNTEIFVENLPPLVNLEIISEDGEMPTFAKEEFDVVVNAIDGDGYIADVRVEIIDQYPEIKYLGKTEIIPLWQEEYKGKFKYVSDIEKLVTFRVTATDDRGVETVLDIKDNIVRPKVYADIQITNEHEVQKKVYRFMELDFTGSYEDAPFGIDHTKSIIKYRFNNGEWQDISNMQDVNDDYIRVHYPNYPVKDRLEMYAKQEGNIEFSLEVFDTKGFDSEEAYKILQIDPDEAPVVNYEIESMQHRITENDVANYQDRSTAIVDENIGKGYIKVIDKSKSNDGDKLRGKVFYLVYDANNDGLDNDLEHMVVVTEDSNGYDSETEIVLNVEETNILKVKDINNIIITFLTQEDGLGDYYIKEKVQEEITQLPSKTSPLYNEILQHELITFSDYSSVFIDNLMPNLTFEIGIDKEINIIVHYDSYIPANMQEKVNELVANLEGRGLKVRLIKYENKY